MCRIHVFHVGYPCRINLSYMSALSDPIAREVLFVFTASTWFQNLIFVKKYTCKLKTAVNSYVLLAKYDVINIWRHINGVTNNFCWSRHHPLIPINFHQYFSSLLFISILLWFWGIPLVYRTFSSPFQWRKWFDDIFFLFSVRDL